MNKSTIQSVFEIFENMEKVVIDDLVSCAPLCDLPAENRSVLRMLLGHPASSYTYGLLVLSLMQTDESLLFSDEYFRLRKVAMIVVKGRAVERNIVLKQFSSGLLDETEEAAEKAINWMGGKVTQQYFGVQDKVPNAQYGMAEHLIKLIPDIRERDQQERAMYRLHATGLYLLESIARKKVG